MPSFNSLGQTVWLSISYKQHHRHLPGSGLYIVDSLQSGFRHLGIQFLVDSILVDSISDGFHHLGIDA